MICFWMRLIEKAVDKMNYFFIDFHVCQSLNYDIQLAEVFGDFCFEMRLTKQSMRYSPKHLLLNEIAFNKFVILELRNFVRTCLFALHCLICAPLDPVILKLFLFTDTSHSHRATYSSKTLSYERFHTYWTKKKQKRMGKKVETNK